MSATFWATHQVGGPYRTLRESQRALTERALLYPTLLELMSIDYPGQTVLDYGCGPGHDTILFLEAGAGHVFYYDPSPLALERVEERLLVHGLENRASPVNLSLDWNLQVDHVHCAGVVHHAEDPIAILKDLRWVLKEDGDARIMVYDGELSTHTQSEVPVTRWWTPTEFMYLLHIAGFEPEHVGSYPCSAPWRPNCFAACFRCLPV